MRSPRPLTKENGDPVSPEPVPPGTIPSVRQLFDEYASFVWRTLRYLGIREADLEDVSQEVFLVVHRKLPDFEGRSTLRTWLYGICLRVAKDQKNRAHVRREAPVSEVPLGSTAAVQEDAVFQGESRALMQRILSELDDAKREVFVLYEIEGLPMNEIAEVVGCPLQTAYSRLHAARRIVNEAASRLQEGQVS